MKVMVASIVAFQKDIDFISADCFAGLTFQYSGQQPGILKCFQEEAMENLRPILHQFDHHILKEVAQFIFFQSHNHLGHTFYPMVIITLLV